MLDLTPKETEAALWCIRTVSAAYSHEPPDDSVLGGLRRKLLDQATPRKAADIPAPVVVVEGTGWQP